MPTAIIDIKPTKVEFLVGTTTKGQTLRLCYQGPDDGFVLLKEAANQRDDNQAIYHLSPEAILAMAAAVERTRTLLK